MKFLPAFTIFIGIILTMGGCVTTTSIDVPEARKGQIILQKGMSADEVRDLLGEPLTIKAKEEGLETWTYEDSREFTSQVQADTREVPYTHPISRETTTIVEAVTKIKTNRITLTTKLFFSKGKLIGWDESTRESSFYHD